MTTTISSFKMKGIKFQYRFTALVATSLGLAILFAPKFTLNFLMMKPQDQVVYGISGSVYLAFGLLSILGMRYPFKWLSILYLQFLYKIIWFAAVIFPMLNSGSLDFESSIWLICGYAIFIAGDIWALPFKYLLGPEVLARKKK